MKTDSKGYHNLSTSKDLFSSDSLSGSSPPSVFVGTFNYPKVMVGPLVPPIHGDTALYDAPEKWLGKSLDEIVNFRKSLIRGVQEVSVTSFQSRYLQNLQEMTMAQNSTDSDIEFYKPTSPIVTIDEQCAPFGPIGTIKSARFSNSTATKHVEKIFYDTDLDAQGAIQSLYQNGIDVSKIQKCLSIGMLGKKRRLVPTRWSITATDDIISKSLTSNTLEYPLIDSCKVFSFEHLGNLFVIILFPHRWVYELIEAWHSQGTLGFSSDCEDARGTPRTPQTAGAFFAAKLAIVEYLNKMKIQCGAIVLREIKPTYTVPVGVWQVREGVRAAMMQKPEILYTLNDAIDFAVNKSGIGKSIWLAKGKMLHLLRQQRISDFF